MSSWIRSTKRSTSLSQRQEHIRCLLFVNFWEYKVNCYVVLRFNNVTNKQSKWNLRASLFRSVFFVNFAFHCSLSVEEGCASAWDAKKTRLRLEQHFEKFFWKMSLSSVDLRRFGIQKPLIKYPCKKMHGLRKQLQTTHENRYKQFQLKIKQRYKVTALIRSHFWSS